MQNTFLDILAIFSIFSSIITISIKNPVLSVLFLISVFINISGFLVIIGLSFVGIAYLIVYVGAVTVLFLFVIIIFNLQFLDFSTSKNFISDYSDFDKRIFLIKIISSIFIYEVIFIFDNLFDFFYNIKDPEGVNSFFPIVNLINNFVFFFQKIHTNPNLYFIYSIDFDMIFNNFQEIESLGIVIYTNCVIWFVMISFILLISIVGPISIHKFYDKNSIHFT